MAQERALIAGGQAAAQRLMQEFSLLSLPAHWVTTGKEAREEMAREAYALLVIALPLGGEGASLALELAGQSDCAILLLGKAADEREPDVQKARAAGVLFLSLPLGRGRLALAVESALCTHRRMVYWRQENALLQRKMRELRSVERAKYLLMQTLGMTEPQAHHFIERQSMDSRQSREEVALRILKTYENA